MSAAAGGLTLAAAQQQQLKLGILAGGGVLPGQLAARLEEQGREVFIAAFEDHAEAAVIAGFDHHWVRLGLAQQIIDVLKQNNVGEVVMVGPVGRPSLRELKTDSRFLKILTKAGLKAFRDDAFLSVIIAEFESEGFVVSSIGDYLNDHLAVIGQMGGISPPTGAQDDIDRGCAVLTQLSPSDVGQAIVVQEGVVLGIEAIEGTDNLIHRCGLLKRAGPGPVLIKLCKDGQSRRADLPTIGPETIRRAAAAGFSGIAVQANGCILVDRDMLVQQADQAGLFICGIDGGANDRS